LEPVGRFDDTINADSTIALFKQLEAIHLTAVCLYVICDNARYYRSKAVQEYLETSRIKFVDQAQPLDLPELDFLELTVLVEEKTKPGFLGDASVSYLFRTDQGSLLFDVGFGPERPALAHNAEKLGIEPDRIDALVISHLHPNHMGD